MSRTPLTAKEIEDVLARLPAWRHQDGRLRRELELPDFTTAFALVTAVALEAARADHHPTWWNSYTRVVIELVTHDAGPAITPMDVALAERIEHVVSQLS